MRIAFIHQDNAFLPELTAYKEFFSGVGIETISIHTSKANDCSAEVYWYFMGTSFKRSAGVTIHEYTSASTPPFANIKDLLKRTFNGKPHFRLFLNQFVHDKFAFNDSIPFGFRDMGVSKSHANLQKKEQEKKFDFIYIGELANRRIEPILELFSTGKLSRRNILILSKNYDQLQSKYRQFNNILFRGPVEPGEVVQYLLQSRFGLNIIPNESPFNQQTSTKLLEYTAAKLPIVSSDYSWIKKFQEQYGGQYYFMKDDLSNLNWEEINSFSYSWAELSKWTWEYQIGRSGVLEFLESKFPFLNLTSSAASGRILQ